MNGLLAALAFVFVSADADAGKELMLDGHCEDHENVAQQTFDLGSGITLYMTQQPQHVWLCYTVPEGQSGVLDMRVEAPGLETALNLHVSAQLGEWAADDKDAAPGSHDAPLWWRTPGWYATPMRYGGLVESEGVSYPRFRSSPGREIQLAKSRFGVGVWKLRLDIDRFEHSDGNMKGIRFPAEGFFKLDVN